VVDIDDCVLLPEPAAAVLREVRALAVSTGLAAHDNRAHRGFFRYLVLRASRATGQVLVGLITSADGPAEPVERMAEDLMRRRPQVAGVYWGRTDRFADVAVPDVMTHLRGEQDIEERIGRFRVRLQPFTFLQANTAQADRLYTRLAEWMGSGDTAWDLYSGAGLIGLYLAGAFRRVFGIDNEPTHGASARRNAELNGVTNITTETGGVEQVLMDRRRWFLERAPDAVVVDPPRAGLTPEVVASVVGARPRRIGYVSCNLSSLTRDLRMLTGSFPRYRVTGVEGVDMFPHTEHVETLVRLER
jgi:23S rRNA (uracil1939-C5)-methyltransferase